MINSNHSSETIKGNTLRNLLVLKEGLILFLGSILFTLLVVIQVGLPSHLEQWQGVFSQMKVMISVYMTVSVTRRGYKWAVILNGLASLMASISFVTAGDVYALPGIVIPLGTIITLSIIVFFINGVNQKSKEVQKIKIQRAREIIELQEVSIMAMAALAETRDNETGKHIQRTKLYVKVLAEYLYENNVYPGVLNEQIVGLFVASAPLHDIGKVGIPDSILLKPARLSPEEFEIIKQHTILGKEAIMKAEKLMGTNETFLKYAQEIVLYHHERWDGTGYLNHIKGEEIPLSARIMSVADVYDALSSKRIYKEIYSHEESLKIICEGSGTQFDPKIVDAFVACNTIFSDIAEAYREK